MSEAEPKERHPYRSAQLREGPRGAPIDERAVTHVIAALGALVSGVVASAVGLRPIAFLLIFGACAVWILWAVPYAMYLVCRGRWSWLSTRHHVTASRVDARYRGGGLRIGGRRSSPSERGATRS